MSEGVVVSYSRRRIEKEKKRDRGHRKANEEGGSANVITTGLSFEVSTSRDTQIFSFDKWRKWK